MEIKRHHFILIILVFVCFSCGKKNDITAKAKEEADNLWREVQDGDASNKFSEKYFPKAQTEAILYDLKNKCDFKNRKGGFVGSRHVKDLKTSREIVQLGYEYYMKCDSVRFIMSYVVSEGQPELVELKLEPVEKVNSMLIK